LLEEALGDQVDCSQTDLPAGGNSFFRQLDHMITTLCNEEFAAIYRLTAGKMSSDEPSKPVVQSYSDMKAAIFTRYRTLSEMLGILLLRKAQQSELNCMMETSGRDVAMFEYVDKFFPAEYKKLVLHFTINDISHAQESVDRRMIQEIAVGIHAAKQGDVMDIINANAGGPYGSEVLPGVQAASDSVWKEIVANKESGVGHDWLKATIQINARDTEPWTAQAVKPDGSLGQVFAFTPRA
jgi:hypothetical protein